MRRTLIVYPCLLAVLASLSSGCCWRFTDTCCRPAWRPFLLRPACASPCAPACGPAGCPAPALAGGPVFDDGFVGAGYGPPVTSFGPPPAMVGGPIAGPGCASCGGGAPY